MWQATLSLCQSSLCWALLEASGSSVYKGDKPGDDACLIVLSVVSLYSWLFFSCPFPWPFIINSQCCFYTTLGRTAHHIPLLAQLCKEKDARVPLDGFFFFFLLALGYSYLLNYHNLIPLHAIFLPFPRSCALWPIIHHLTEFHGYSGVRLASPMWHHLLSTPVWECGTSNTRKF